MEEEADKLLDQEQVKREALTAVEQNGIVFLDEIDKISRGEHRGGADVSREGVQRDLLPLIEGTSVTTKHGAVRTEHILFIASGAFHNSKPSDLLPELQGRLPIRVELHPLTEQDLARILVEPEASLIKQYVALLATEGVTLEFTDGAVAEIARLATEINERVENIGARRLHTVMERLVEEISFTASDRAGEVLVIDPGLRARPCRPSARGRRPDQVHPVRAAGARRPAGGGPAVARAVTRRFPQHSAASRLVRRKSDKLY